MVEEATRGLSTLQVRVDQVHKQSLDDSHQLRLSHQQHLESKTLQLNPIHSLILTLLHNVW